MLSIVGFILVLIPLVVVHELGHFLFAKLFNVRADAFSVGFGPVLFHKKLGETDFRISAIPLGGYVKLLGEDPTAELSDEDKKRALHHQTPLKRFFIFFGGPLFNFIWAALVFMAMMAIGEPQLATVMGRVLPDTAAARAGLVSGDKIVEVEGAPVQKLEELFAKIADRPGQEVAITVNRKNTLMPLKVMTTNEDGFSVYGEQKKVGTIEGIMPFPRLTKVGVSNPTSLAAQAGFKSGDEIVSMNGERVTSFEQVEEKYAGLQKTRTPVVFEVKTNEAEHAPKTITLLPVKGGDLAKDFGLHSSELFVEQAMSDTPAQQAGIKKGDRLTQVNGAVVRSFFELRTGIQKAGEEKGKVTISVERDGKIINFEIIPQISSERDPLLKKRVQYTIGVMPVQSMGEAVMVVERILNPVTLVFKGTERMIELSTRNLISIGKMFMGKVSVKSLGGPILIGKLAGDSLSHGLLDFLKMMAILSIGLGVLNILPIPVLDGGHIVLLGIEVVRGKALSFKQIEVAQQVGLVLILLIMVVVMKNDISRLPIFN